MNLRLELTRRALEVGAILNTVGDDEERELLQEHYEQVLNDELFAGSQSRKLAGLVSPLRVASTGPSVGSDPRDGYALGDVKRISFESRDW